jgi:hypothetical protein
MSTCTIVAACHILLIACGRIALAQVGSGEPPIVSKKGHAERVNTAKTNLDQSNADLAPKANDFRKKDRELKEFVQATPVVRSSAEEDRLRELKAARERAAREATEETLRKFEAEKRLRRAVQEQAREEPEAAPAVAAIVKNVPKSSLPKPGTLENLQLFVKDNYAMARATNRVLEGGRHSQPIPLEELQRTLEPVYVRDPSEVLSRDYQAMYDSAPPVKIPVVAQPHKQPGGRVPRVPPSGTADVGPPQPGPIRLAGTSWSGSNGSTYQFLANGTLIETLASGAGHSGAWQAAGNGATGMWQKNYGPAVQRRDYRIAVSGNRVTLTVTESWTPQVDTPATPETIELTPQ